MYEKQLSETGPDTLISFEVPNLDEVIFRNELNKTEISKLSMNFIIQYFQLEDKTCILVVSDKNSGEIKNVLHYSSFEFRQKSIMTVNFEPPYDEQEIIYPVKYFQKYKLYESK